MATFTGTLSIIGHQSNLDDGATDWLLLRAGLSDPAQATFAATQFLVKEKKLHSNQTINVQGSSGTIGTVSIISMTDASAAGPEAAFNESFALSGAVAPPRAGAGKKGSNKRKLGGRSRSDTKKSRNQSPSGPKGK
jgi:hypothetical protein